MSFALDKSQKSESRLRLRNNNHETSGCSQSSLSLNKFDECIDVEEIAAGNDDSLTDFKSPKLESKSSQRDVVQILPNSIKREMNGRRKKNTNRVGGNARDYRDKKNQEKNQQSIESSFFKVQPEKSNFLCPFCSEAFGNRGDQENHTKNCSIKDKISNKKSSGKRLLLQDDPDVELALALSASLSEVHRIEQFEEAVAMAAEYDENILQMTSSQRKSTLQSFGFSTNKPTNEAFSRPTRRKKLLGPTVLQTRTQDTRDRILTDRIAEILVGSESITQQKIIESKPTRENAKKIREIHSKTLRKWYKPQTDLWNRANCKFTVIDYYVKNLHECVTPPQFYEDEQTATNLKTKVKNSDVSECEESRLSSVHQMSEDNEDKIAINENKIDDTNEAEVIDTSDVERFEKSNSDHLKSSLANDWSKMVACKYLSDTAVFVKDSGFIHAHNLVLWTRCPSLTKDYESCSENNDDKCYSIKYKIHWPHVDHSAAMAFLKYLYCDFVCPITLQNKHVLDQIRWLGEKYQVTNLLQDLKLLENNSVSSGCTSHEKNVLHNEEEAADDTLLLADSNEEIESLENITESDKKVANRQSLSVSPDLFNDSELFEDVPSLAPAQTETKNNQLQISPKLTIEISSSEDHTSPKNSSILSPNLATKTLKAKSNLSLFIDKIHRRQARDLLESDTDEDTPVKDVQLRRRTNPFKIQPKSDDCYGSKKRRIINNDTTTTNKKSALSMLEDEIRERAEKDNQSENSETNVENNAEAEVLADSDSESQSSLDSLDESLYTKYMKNQAKIVKEDQKVSQNVETNGEDGDFKSPEEKDNNAEKPSTNLTYLFDSDFEPPDLSIAITNDHQPSTNFISANTKNASHLSPHTDMKIGENGENESPREIARNSQVSNFSKISEEFEFDSWNDVSKIENETSNHPLTQSTIQKHNSQDLDKKNVDAVAYINDFDSDTVGYDRHISEIMHLSQNLSEEIQDCLLEHQQPSETTFSGYSRVKFISSPIVLSSASSDDDENGKICENSSPKLQILMQKPNDTENKNCEKIYENVLTTPINNRNVTFRPRISKSRFSKRVHSISDNSDDENHMSQRSWEISQNLEVEDRSDPDTDLKIEGSSSPLTQKPAKPSPQNRSEHSRMPLSVDNKSVEVSYDITPPADYKNMPSPELQQELNKFGLKSQKRCRAVQLLEHIYDQLHPFVPVDSLPPETSNCIDIEDDEPPRKKQQVDFHTAVSRQRSVEDSDDESASSLIAEEMDFSHLEETSDNSPISSFNVKEAFTLLLKDDKQMHNKILCYEPLSLEFLYEKFKNRGFKGKVSEIMDFLDDECITFQVQQQNRKNRGQSKRKKKNN